MSQQTNHTLIQPSSSPCGNQGEILTKFLRMFCSMKTITGKSLCGGHLTWRPVRRKHACPPAWSQLSEHIVACYSFRATLDSQLQNAHPYGDNLSICQVPSA